MLVLDTDKETILVVDDSLDTLELIQRNLSGQGFRVFTAGDVTEAVRLLAATTIDLVITDLKMPKISGMDLVRHVKENYDDVEVMMITGYATIEGAVEAVKTGAEEYLAKPFTDEELFAAVGRALEKLHTRRALRPPSGSTAVARGLIGESPAIQKVFTSIAKAAATTATVLISGESGTGKELVARAIHYGSPQPSAPFVPVNCGGIPEALLESELFGHVKGAFTGALDTKAGFFQTANGGTIFLDEISETSPTMQVKLLRVLQEKEVCMIGSSQAKKIDVRIVSSTNKDLQGLVKKGTFREDLYYRLNVLTINVPPLRERENDVLLLVEYFTKRFAREFSKAAPQFSDEVLQALRNYSWPGNVRELENLVQRLIVMSESDRITVPDLPAHMRFSVAADQGLQRTLAEVEAEHIRNVLTSVDGNKSRAAEILGIDRKTLREKMKAYAMGST